MELNMNSSTLEDAVIQAVAYKGAGDQEEPRDFSPDDGRKCFVTVGATAGFRDLLEAVLQVKTLECLKSLGFTRLDLQCGPDLQWVKTHILDSRLLEVAANLGMHMTFQKYCDQISNEYLECRSQPEGRPMGVVIGHAGSGTILDCLRIGVPLVVIPNSGLQNDHQSELAIECQEQGWAVFGSLTDIPCAIERSLELVNKGRMDELPPYQDPPFPLPEDRRFTLFDWAVLTCYPEELKKYERQHAAGSGQLQPVRDDRRLDLD